MGNENFILDKTFNKALTKSEFEEAKKEYLKTLNDNKLHDIRLNGSEKAAMRHYQSTETLSDSDKTIFLMRLNSNIDFVGQVKGKTDPVYLRFRMEQKEIIQNGKK